MKKYLILFTILLLFLVSLSLSGYAASSDKNSYKKWIEGEKTAAGRQANTSYARGLLDGFRVGQKFAEDNIISPKENMDWLKSSSAVHDLVNEVYKTPKYRSYDYANVLIHIVMSKDRADLYKNLDAHLQKQ